MSDAPRLVGNARTCRHLSAGRNNGVGSRKHCIIQRPARRSTTNITTSSPFQASNVDQTRSFPPEALAAAGVRRFVADWLSGRGLEDWAAVLLASELASNAAKHAATEFTVAIGMRGDKVRLEVADGGSIVHCVAATARDSEHGRGLHLVQALSTAWGVEERPRGKSVFCEVPAQPLAASR
jgi:anti-sigma regulatory factor (Ser/Thr protein kinase)